MKKILFSQITFNITLNCDTAPVLKCGKKWTDEISKPCISSWCLRTSCPKFVTSWRKSPPWHTARRPDSTGATPETGHPNSMSCNQFGYNWNCNHRTTSIHNRLSQTPKATSYGPEPQIPHSCTRPHSSTRPQFQTAAGWCPKTPHENAKARPSRCAGVPGRHERFWRRHPKAHPNYRMTRSKDPGLEQFCPIRRDKCSRSRSHHL